MSTASRSPATEPQLTLARSGNYNLIGHCPLVIALASRFDPPLRDNTVRLPSPDNGRCQEDDQFLLLFRVHLALKQFAEPWDISDHRHFAQRLGNRVLNQTAQDDRFAAIHPDQSRSLFN